MLALALLLVQNPKSFDVTVTPYDIVANVNIILEGRRSRNINSEGNLVNVVEHPNSRTSDGLNSLVQDKKAVPFIITPFRTTATFMTTVSDGTRAYPNGNFRIVMTPKQVGGTAMSFVVDMFYKGHHLLCNTPLNLDGPGSVLIDYHATNPTQQILVLFKATDSKN